MAPAIRPAFSCSPPSAAVTVVTLSSLKESGRAPYESMLPRSCADCWVKPPEISALPPVSAWLTDGSEMTRPSSTIANWFCGICLVASSPVILANLSAPLSVNCMVTIHWPRWGSMTPLASFTSWPLTWAGPSTHLPQASPR